MLRFLRPLLVALILLSAACGYGPERTALRLDSIATKPCSHEIAVSVEYARVRDPTGFVSTFPNGGNPKSVFREARVYRSNLSQGSIELVAAIPDFGGIPHPKSVYIHGWKADVLYFSLFGYGGNARTGDDHADERRLFYRVNADGRIEEVHDLPVHLERGRNSGPVVSCPFLRWSRRHLDVEIAVDKRISEATDISRLTFEPVSGEPRLFIP
jgi:hypothetical protein